MEKISCERWVYESVGDRKGYIWKSNENKRLNGSTWS